MPIMGVVHGIEPSDTGFCGIVGCKRPWYSSQCKIWILSEYSELAFRLKKELAITKVKYAYHQEV